jgi:hypothetical protein
MTDPKHPKGPPSILPVKDNTKAELAIHLPPFMDAYVFSKGKEGGVNVGGEKEGIYKYHYMVANEGAGGFDGKTQSILFKQEIKKNIIQHGKNIAEFVSGKIMNKLAPDSAAAIFLALSGTPKDGKLVADQTGENVFIGSLYFDKYTDLYKEIFDIKKGGDRPRAVGTIHRTEFRKGLLDDGGKCKFEDFERPTIASLLVGDFDVHSGNYGVSKDRSEKGRLVKIDHGWGLYHLEDEVHMHSVKRHLVPGQPTNHFREFPTSLKISQPFAEELDRQAAVPLAETIEATLNEVSQFYGARPVADFVSNLGINIQEIFSNKDIYTKLMSGSLQAGAEDNEVKQQLIDVAKEFLTKKMAARQESLKQLSLEIKLSLCVTKEVGGDFKLSPAIDDLIRNNKDYFEAGDFHFRQNFQRNRILPALAVSDQSLTKLVNQRVEKILHPPINLATSTLSPTPDDIIAFKISLSAFAQEQKIEDNGTQYTQWYNRWQENQLQEWQKVLDNVEKSPRLLAEKFQDLRNEFNVITKLNQAYINGYLGNEKHGDGIKKFYHTAYPHLSEALKTKCNDYVSAASGESYSKEIFAIAKSYSPESQAQSKGWRERISDAWNSASFGGKFALVAGAVLGVGMIATGLLLISAATFGVVPLVMGCAALAATGIAAGHSVAQTSKAVVYPEPSLMSQKKSSTTSIISAISKGSEVEPAPIVVATNPANNVHLAQSPAVTSSIIKKSTHSASVPLKVTPPIPAANEKAKELMPELSTKIKMRN